LGGGALSDRLMGYGAHTRLWICSIAAFLGTISATLLPFASGAWSAGCIVGFLVFFGAVPFSVGNAALQSVAPPDLRGTVSAVYYLSISIIGSAGPIGVAVLTDHLFHNATRLNASLAIVSSVAFAFSAVLYLLAIGPYKRALGISSKQVRNCTKVSTVGINDGRNSE
jgi:MFS family permease